MKVWDPSYFNNLVIFNIFILLILSEKKFNFENEC